MRSRRLPCMRPASAALRQFRYRRGLACRVALPGIQMLGIPSMEVMESRGRIRCAMRSAGFEIPRSGITVNLAPGDIRKTGSGFDLPIAIAVLAADGQIPRDNLDRCLIAGELGLDGTVLPVKGEVAFQLLARDMGAFLYRR